MNSIQHIERAIDALPPQQIDELHGCLDQRHPLQIDARLKTDLEAGRVDVRMSRALADHKAGNTQVL